MAEKPLSRVSQQHLNTALSLRLPSPHQMGVLPGAHRAWRSEEGELSIFLGTFPMWPLKWHFMSRLPMDPPRPEDDTPTAQHPCWAPGLTWILRAFL